MLYFNLFSQSSKKNSMTAQSTRRLFFLLPTSIWRRPSLQTERSDTVATTPLVDLQHHADRARSRKKVQLYSLCVAVCTISFMNYKRSCYVSLKRVHIINDAEAGRQRDTVRVSVQTVPRVKSTQFWEGGAKKNGRWRVQVRGASCRGLQAQTMSLEGNRESKWRRCHCCWLRIFWSRNDHF